MVQWIVVVCLYLFVLFFFHLLGGLGAAGRAIERWGRESSIRRVEQSGLGWDEFARRRLGNRR
jgi:hypothetical protein